MKNSFKIDEKAIRSLAQIIHETDLQEIEYECEAGRLRVTRNGSPTNATFAPPVPTAPSQIHEPLPQKQESATTNWETHPGIIKSPMVATAYSSPQPGAEPFVKEGDTVEKGQTLMILEAMKVMNPLKSPKSGKVLKVLVEDLSPVEFDQPLIVIE